MNEATDLEKISDATRMLAEAKDLPDIVKVIGLAEAGVAYAKAAHLGAEAQNIAAEIALRGKRKAGEVLAQLNRATPQTARITGNVAGDSEYARVLEETQTTGRDARRWQTIASLPEEEFEEHIAETKADGKELTSAGIIKEVQKEQREQMHEEKRTRELPKGKYSAILADPPWQYDNSGFDESADNQYPTMPTDDICSLPIADLADDTTVLKVMQTADVDCMIKTRDGLVTLAEIKSDQYIGISGNILFETVRINHTSSPDYCMTLGWSARTPAKYIIYYSPKLNKIFVTTSNDLRSAMQKYTRDFRKQTNISYVETDAIKSTVNILIPQRYCKFTIYDLQKEMLHG